MSSLSEDLEACVLRTEDMLIGWTEFALKYSKENVNLDVQIYRERLLSAFNKFDEVSREVDKIVFCSVDKNSHLATEPSRSAVTTTISAQPTKSAEYVVKTMNSPKSSVDSSSQSSAEISQPNPPAELIAPNVRIGDQRRNAKHLSPARFKNEARRFEGRKNNVMSSEVGGKSYTDFAASDEDDHLVVDLTEDSPLLLEIEHVYSLDDEFTNESISSTSVKDSEKANPITDWSASRSSASILDRNTDISKHGSQKINFCK